MGNEVEIYKKENAIKDVPDSLSLEQLEQAKFQMENCVCKIKYEDKEGTGFFCKIPFKNSFNLLPTLITCNHVLDKKTLIKRKKLDISLNNESIFYSLSIDNERKIYTDEEKDVTIIEIRPESDNIKDESFLDLDENIFNEKPDKIYRNKSVYIIYYPLYENKKRAEYSIGTIKSIVEDNYTIFHLCPTQTGSSGGPIINVSNLKVIGVHKGAKKNKSFNFATLMRAPIREFLFQTLSLSNKISGSINQLNSLNQSIQMNLSKQSNLLNQSNVLSQEINLKQSNYLNNLNKPKSLFF